MSGSFKKAFGLVKRTGRKEIRLDPAQILEKGLGLSNIGPESIGFLGIRARMIPAVAGKLMPAGDDPADQRRASAWLRCQ